MDLGTWFAATELARNCVVSNRSLVRNKTARPFALGTRTLSCPTHTHTNTHTHTPRLEVPSRPDHRAAGDPEPQGTLSATHSASVRRRLRAPGPESTANHSTRTLFGAQGCC